MFGLGWCCVRYVMALGLHQIFKTSPSSIILYICYSPHAMAHLSCPVCTLPHGVTCPPFWEEQDSLCYCVDAWIHPRWKARPLAPPEPQCWHRAHWVAWSDLSRASLSAVQLSLFKSPCLLNLLMHTLHFIGPWETLAVRVGLLVWWPSCKWFVSLLHLLLLQQARRTAIKSGVARPKAAKEGGPEALLGKFFKDYKPDPAFWAHKGLFHVKLCSSFLHP